MKRKNSYDFIRLLAATLVVFSHSFAMSGNPEPQIGSEHLGTIGVWIFFILSGYLIAKSWDQYPRFNVFFAKRFLRIFPGLLVNLLLTIVVLGAFYSTIPFFQFLQTPGSIEYINNILLFPHSYILPGVFASNPYPLGVNGSLWTLWYEFTMYISVALIGVLKIYRKVSIVHIWLVLFALEILILAFNIDFGERSIFFLRPERFVQLGLMFFSGVLMYKKYDSIKLDYRVGIVSLVVFLVLSSLLPTLTPIFSSILLAYAIFSLGESSRMSWLTNFGDISYGIYIYSFPILQMIEASTQTHDAIKLFIAGFSVTAIMAWLSWAIVESKALKYKGKINTKKYPILQADSSW